jgi:hypothetical protein
MRIAFAPVLAVALCGCPPAGEETAVPDNDTDTEAVFPTEGHWSYDSEEVTENTCDLPSGGDGGGGFTLALTGNGIFELTSDDGYGTFPCTLDGEDFTCDPQIAWEEDLSQYGLDAILSAEATVEGTFTAPDQMTGSRSSEMSCVGDDCDQAWADMGAEPPCVKVVAFTASVDG